MNCPNSATWGTSGAAALLTLIYILAHQYFHKYIYFLSWAPIRVLVMGVLWSFADTESSNLAFYVSYIGFATSALFLILTRVVGYTTSAIVNNTVISLVPTAIVVILFMNGQRQTAEITSIVTTVSMGFILIYLELDKMRPPSSSARHISLIWGGVIVAFGASFTFLSSYLECSGLAIWAGLVASTPIHNTLSLLFLVDGDTEEVVHIWSIGEVIHIANFTVLVVLAYFDVEVQNFSLLHNFATWQKLALVAAVITVFTPILIYILHFLVLKSVRLPQRAEMVLARPAVPQRPPNLSDTISGVSYKRIPNAALRL